MEKFSKKQKKLNQIQKMTLCFIKKGKYTTKINVDEMGIAKIKSR